MALPVQGLLGFQDSVLGDGKVALRVAGCDLVEELSIWAWKTREEENRVKINVRKEFMAFKMIREFLMRCSKLKKLKKF